MPFDPTKPFETVSVPKGFEPSKPFEPVSSSEQAQIAQQTTPVDLSQFAHVPQGTIVNLPKQETTTRHVGLGNMEEGSPAQRYQRWLNEQLGVQPISEPVTPTVESQALQEQIAPYLGATALTKGVPIAASLVGQEAAGQGGGTLVEKALPDTFKLEYPTLSKALEITGSIIAGGVAGWKVPSNAREAKTAFGAKIDAIPDAGARQEINSALDRLDELGIQQLDDQARAMLLDDITSGKLSKGSVTTDEQVSKKVNALLNKQKKKEYTLKNKAYEKANTLASQTDEIRLNGQAALIESDLKQKILDKTLREDEVKAYNRIINDMKNVGAVTAEGIEKQLQEWKKLQRMPSNNAVQHIYDEGISMLQNKQKELLDNAGIGDVYAEPRELVKELNRRWKGKGTGEGVSTGTKVKSVVDAQDAYDVTKDILSPSIDRNMAARLAKDFPERTRRDMVMNLLVDGIDNINTPDGAMMVLRNYKKMNKDSIRLMLGKERASDVSRTMQGLATVEAALKRARTDAEKEVINDLIEMGGALAAVKISPYAATHVTINKAKSLIKSKIGATRAETIKRIETIGDKNLKASLMRAFMLMGIDQVGDIEREQDKYNKQAESQQ